MKFSIIASAPPLVSDALYSLELSDGVFIAEWLHLNLGKGARQTSGGSAKLVGDGTPTTNSLQGLGSSSIEASI